MCTYIFALFPCTWCVGSKALVVVALELVMVKKFKPKKSLGQINELMKRNMRSYVKFIKSMQDAMTKLLAEPCSKSFEAADETCMAFLAVVDRMTSFNQHANRQSLHVSHHLQRCISVEKAHWILPPTPPAEQVSLTSTMSTKFKMEIIDLDDGPIDID